MGLIVTAARVRTIAFFNNKGGVGKTTLVYHLAWMFAELGVDTLAVDLDPQADLTASFLSDEEVEAVWDGQSAAQTVFDTLRPLIAGTGVPTRPRPAELRPPHMFDAAGALWLLPGDLRVSTLEDELSRAWGDCADRRERAFRITAAFDRLAQEAARERRVELILVDLGPNLGAINRAALLMADDIVIPMCPDLYSLQGLRNLGPTLRAWRGEWRRRVEGAPAGLELSLPRGEMQPLGYVVLQHSVRLDRPVKAYDHWIERIPAEYREHMLGEPPTTPVAVSEDPHCLSSLKHYRSLMPLAQERRKPMFKLSPADGAIGSHAKAVADVDADFRRLAREIARRTIGDLR